MRALTENRLLRWVPPVAWMAVIFFLSSQSSLPSVLPRWAETLQDVVGHFVGFGVLAVLLAWALGGADDGRAVWWSLALVLLYAISDEVHQAFVPGRNPDVFDIATDMAGAACALLVLRVLLPRRRQHRSPRLPPPQ